MSNVLKLSKHIPPSREAQYINAGWQFGCMSNAKADSVFIQREVHTNAGHDVDDYLELKPLYHIQRGRIRRPLGKHLQSTVTQAIDLDYMGNAHFEFGALPRSLRRIQAQFGLYQLYKVEDLSVAIDRQVFVLRVFANFDTDAQRLQYQSWLQDLAADKVRMEEYSGFEKRMRPPNFPIIAANSSGFDVWWDIVNDVFFSFDKNFMNRIDSHLRISFEALDHQNEKD